MTRRRFRAPENPYPPHWEIAHEVKLDGRHPLTVGREFRVKGERGRFIFKRFVTNTKTGAQWIDCAGPNRQFRSIRPERVKRVHNKKLARSKK